MILKHLTFSYHHSTFNFTFISLFLSHRQSMTSFFFFSLYFKMYTYNHSVIKHFSFFFPSPNSLTVQENRMLKVIYTVYNRMLGRLKLTSIKYASMNIVRGNTSQKYIIYIYIYIYIYFGQDYIYFFEEMLMTNSLTHSI